MQHLQPAWVSEDGLDSETVARISYLLAPFLMESGARDSATLSGLALDAAEVFQLLHFTFDDIYWDTRDFPETVCRFVNQIIVELQQEPTWVNNCYVTGHESLKSFLSRRRFGSDWTST